MVWAPSPPFGAGSVTYCPLTADIGPEGSTYNGTKWYYWANRAPAPSGPWTLAERAGAIPHELPSNINVCVPPPLHRRPTPKRHSPRPKHNPLDFPPKSRKM